MKEILGEKGLVFSLEDFNSFREKVLYAVKAGKDELKDLGNYYLNKVQELCGYDAVLRKRWIFLKGCVREKRESFIPF